MPSTPDIVERLRRLADLAPKGAIQFLSVGVIGLCVDLATFTALHAAGVDKAVARAVSIPVATLVTWTLNRRVTFTPSGRSRRHEIARYAVVTGFAQAISYVTFLAVCALLPHQPPQ